LAEAPLSNLVAASTGNHELDSTHGFEKLKVVVVSRNIEMYAIPEQGEELPPYLFNFGIVAMPPISEISQSKYVQARPAERNGNRICSPLSGRSDRRAYRVLRLLKLQQGHRSTLRRRSRGTCRKKNG
jgi:hypothetical protein